MKPKELKAKLGKYSSLLLYPAFSRAYWKQVVYKDLNIQPERIDAICDAIDQQIKELRSIKKEIKPHQRRASVH